MARRLRADEDGAFPIFEAVIVAVLIITTIIFFTSLQRPTTATDAGGLDLGRLAADTLVVLRTREFTAAACGEVDATVDEWVDRVMTPESATDSCMADAVAEFLDEVLPPGTNFQLRLDNGVEPLRLVPFGAEDPPRAAHAAQVYLDPRWRANAVTDAAAAGLELVSPGQTIPDPAAGLPVASSFVRASAVTCIEAPNGSARAPDGATWLSHWLTAVAEGTTADVVPGYAPYGTWAAFTDGAPPDGTTDCDGAVASRVRVGLPPTQVPFTADPALDTIQDVGHGLAAGQLVVVASSGTGTLPGGLAAGTAYYVVDPTADTFKLAATSGGAPLDLTDSGVGDQTYVAEHVRGDWAVYGLQLVVWFGA